MESQSYHIQVLLVDELDSCKEKGNEYVEAQIKKIQDMYKQDDLEIKKPQIDKEKQVQDEEVFLYKLYDINESKPKTPELTFVQDKINNLEKYMKFI